MRLANYEDFETESGLYWPSYYDAPYFRARAERMAVEFPGASILVAGCGWGYTVRHGRALGLNIWGCDLSDYALAHVVDPHVFRMDICAVTWPLDYDVVVTEDLLPMLTRDEIDACLTAVRTATTVVHIVTPAPEQVHPAIQTALSLDEWRALLAPDRFWAVGHDAC